MTQKQNKSAEFYVPYLWDAGLCMCDLFMEIHKEKERFSIFEMLLVETFFRSI